MRDQGWGGTGVSEAKQGGAFLWVSCPVAVGRGSEEQMVQQSIYPEQGRTAMWGAGCGDRRKRACWQ